ncbi:MAG: hypothetical protein WCS52_17035 [bacterium]
MIRLSAKLGVVAMILMAGILSGCIDNTTVVEVRKDGSGMVSEVTYMSPAMDQMINQMMQGLMSGMSNTTSGAEGKAELSVTKSGSAKMLDRKQYEIKAMQMGDGVSVANVSEVTRKDGASGVRVDYSFKDITKLKIESASSPEATLGVGSGGMETEKPAKRNKPMTFAFTAGPTAKLIITMPPDESAAPGGAAGSVVITETNGVARGDEKGQPASEPNDKAMENSMRSMLKDFRMSLRIKVDGEIRKSNAAFIQVGGTSHKKQYVTLYNVELGKIMSDPGLFAKYGSKLEELQSMGDSPDARKILMDLPGIQIETEKKIEIEFQ